MNAIHSQTIMKGGSQKNNKTEIYKQNNKFISTGNWQSWGNAAIQGVTYIGQTTRLPNTPHSERLALPQGGTTRALATEEEGHTWQCLR